jgi:RND superfamily putative drug exporter
MNELTTIERWGHISYRARRLILWVALCLVGFGAVWGSGVFGQLQDAGGFNAPSSQSQHESQLATSTFGRDAGDVVVLYSSATQSVRAPAYRGAVEHTLASLPQRDVLSVATYWSTNSSKFISTDGHETFAVIELTGANDDARQGSYDAVKGDLAAAGLRDEVGGLVATNATISSQTSQGIKTAETLSMPILLLLLLLIFGSLVAASLPLAIGVIGILGSFTMLRALTLFTGVSIFSVNITTILGLGLGIDYGLFMVNRFREELRRNSSVEDAVARTMATSGRTVLFSGITVAVALSSLILFPESFLRSMGYGGVLTVLIDVLAALTVMPALLSVLGGRVNSLRIRRSVNGAPKPVEGGAWYRLAKAVMRKPMAVALAIVIALLALGSPFLHVAWGGTDATVLPSSASPRIVAEALAHDFPGNPTSPIEAVVQFKTPVSGSTSNEAELTGYVAHLREVRGVTGASVTGMRGDTVRIDVSYLSSPDSTNAMGIVARVRDVASPADASRYVGGVTAELTDTLSSLSSTLPWMALIVLLATFVLLFLAFGSVVLPLKAIALNILSLSVMFGVLVYIFQDGHGSGLLNFTANGTINPATPILMFAIMFGLSMDYEVFLLSRIRESYLETGDNETAIATGLQKTGGVITGAALMLAVVIGAFSLSNITVTKMMGVGMVVALVVDATIVRLLLVPSTMKMLGDRNWWAPAPLRRWHARHGFEEGPEASGATTRQEERELVTV